MVPGRCCLFGVGDHGEFDEVLMPDMQLAIVVSPSMAALATSKAIRNLGALAFAFHARGDVGLR